MQIESLKVFCDLAETESFTKAAQINGVTQSAVSQQISSLERQFKSLLIERSKKKFRLTREGQALCFFAGANSIFYGDKLLTAANPGVDADRSLLDELGLGITKPEPLAVV